MLAAAVQGTGHASWLASAPQRMSPVMCSSTCAQPAVYVIESACLMAAGRIHTRVCIQMHLHFSIHELWFTSCRQMQLAESLLCGGYDADPA